jgi:uncharacterized protein YbjQ (UPF0145 family)
MKSSDSGGSRSLRVWLAIPEAGSGIQAGAFLSQIGTNWLYTVRNMIQPAKVTTSSELHGFTVKRSLGVVRGITVRSRSILGTLGGALQTVVGGNITAFTNLCERSREEAFELMLTHAAEIGANAVIGMRYDANEVMDGVTEVLAYGTAVQIEPV